jgi:hypothetical protein
VATFMAGRESAGHPRQETLDRNIFTGDVKIINW